MILQKQPKPDSLTISEIVNDIERGEIKIPRFQREFVWEIGKTASLFDSVLKGYPIGTFTLWETTVRMEGIRNIGDQHFPDTPEDKSATYVLDGQQRITSLFAGFKGLPIRKAGEKRVTDYGTIVVDLDADAKEGPVVMPHHDSNSRKIIPLLDVLNFDPSKALELQENDFSREEIKKIDGFRQKFMSYPFSVVILRSADVDSAIEVFTRINTSGQPLTLFEIMCAKTYDETKGFDMRQKWDDFIEEVERSGYGSIAPTIVLNLLSLMLTDPHECARKNILNLSLDAIIGSWESALSAIRAAIDYLHNNHRLPVSMLLPYDTLIVPYAFFFWKMGGKPHNGAQAQLLEEFFWRISLSFRYSSGTATKLAQDIRRILQILAGERPRYDDCTLYVTSPDDLVNLDFRAGNSLCKAILCILASQEPVNFHDSSKVRLDNSWLKIASSKNYHHFFPKAFLKKNGRGDDANSMMNITFVGNDLNKNVIRAKAPSAYIAEFARGNDKIADALATHFIDAEKYDVDGDAYDQFCLLRAEWIHAEIEKRLNPSAAGQPVAQSEDAAEDGLF